MTKPTFKFHFPIVFATVAADTEKHGRLLKRLDKIIAEVNGAVEAGQVIMADSKTIREHINSFVEDSFKAIIAERYTYGGQWEKLPLELQHFDYCYEARLIPSHLKKLNKVSAEGKKAEFWGVSKVWCDQLMELADVVAYLKTIEVKATAVRAAAKAKKAEELRIKNDTDVVYKAVLPMKDMAMDRAEELFRKDIEKAAAALEKHGGDIDLIAPYPAEDQTRENRDQFQAVDMARMFFYSICTRPNALVKPNLLALSAEKVEEEVAKTRRAAGAEFDAFVYKLNAKINDVTVKASITGNPWIGSHLIVETKNKGTQLWHTQIIVNRSKLGKLFNQFPTRLVK